MTENEKLTCPICGEPTRVWYGNARKDGLCGKHADMLKAEEIFLDQHGRWREAATKNALSQTKKETVIAVPHEEAKSEQKAEPVAAVSELTCIICGEPSHGKEVCKSCYSEIMNCQNDLDKNKKSGNYKIIITTLRLL